MSSKSSDKKPKNKTYKSADKSSDNKPGNTAGNKEDKPKDKVYKAENDTKAAYVDYDGDGKISETEYNDYNNKLKTSVEGDKWMTSLRDLKTLNNYLSKDNFGINYYIEAEDARTGPAHHLTNKTTPTSAIFKLDYSASQLKWDFPNWGVENYIEERTRWQKGATSIADELGWFYFKVLFKFNTNYGLFGGVLTNEFGYQYGSSNTALQYLWTLRHFYKQEKLNDRIIALYKFTSMLMKINTEYPWMIKGVNNLADALNTYTQEFSKERSFDILFNNERTDMKISTLLDLYKFICYDDINCKEILPENLRKFDMSIVFYHIPIKYFQTAIMVAPKKQIQTGLFTGRWAKVESIIEKVYNFMAVKTSYYKFKRMQPDMNNWSNVMSYKMLTFQNCEIDTSSFGKYIENAEINNEKAFMLGNNAMKIKYDRVYYHNMNEWNQFMFGSDGFYYNVVDPSPNGMFKPDNPVIGASDPTDDSNSFVNYWEERLKSIKSAREASYFFDKNAEQYKALIDYSEAFITNGLMSMDMEDYYAFIKGNIYGGAAKRDSEYFTNKLKALKSGMVSGNIYGKALGPNDVGINSDEEDDEREKGKYFKDKISTLKKGSISGNVYDRIYGRIGDKNNRKNTPYLDKKLELLNGDGSKGNLFGVKIDPSKKVKQFLNNKLGINTDLDILGEIDEAEKSIETVDYQLAPLDEFKENENLELYKDIRSKINAAPDNGIKYNEVKRQETKIWNYELTGSSKKSSVGILLDAGGDVASFFKWRK